MSDVLKRSVTADDYKQNGTGTTPATAPIYIYLTSSEAGMTVAQAPGLPPWWSQARDYVLRATMAMEDMWASAVAKAISKQTALGFTIEDSGESDRRVNRAQELLNTAEIGQGWTPFLSRHLQDFLLTDNGAFVEIVRSSRAAGSRIIGLVHLDSLRCLRTDDPTRPIIYHDLYGRWHVMRDHQVCMLSDLPSARVNFYGVGRCAASRAYRTILKLSAVETYFYEKVSGKRNLAIHLVSGINKDRFEEAIQSADESRAAQGFTVYKGAIIIPTMAMEAPPSVVTIPLAEIPDGFNAETERSDAYLRYANALGVPVQDIQPLSGQGLGTGTQSVILHEAAEGQGLAAWRKQFEHMLSFNVLPASTTFTFATNDIRDQQANAETSNLRAQTRAAQIGSGEITPQEARQIALDDGDLPKEMVQNDATPGQVLTDNEKPLEEQVNTLLTAFRGKARKLTLNDIDDDDIIARAAILADEAGRRTESPLG